jgi:hypothetical protein
MHAPNSGIIVQLRPNNAHLPTDRPARSSGLWLKQGHYNAGDCQKE